MNRKHALCIGVNSYPGTDSDLAGCVNDARDWASELQSRGFTLETLLDSAATGNSIRDALIALTHRAQPGDVVVISFSGHGSFIVDEDGDEHSGMDECWCPHDVIEQGPLTSDELNRLFSRRMGGVRWVVISDSCHSGTVNRFVTGLPEDDAFGGGNRHSVRFLAPSIFDDRLRLVSGELADARFNASPPGRESSLLISGCEDGEYSYDAYFRGRPNGAFTRAALTSLRELGLDASYSDWHQRIREYLPTSHSPQSPQLYGDKAAGQWNVFQFEDEFELGATSAGPVYLGKNVTSISFGANRAKRVIQGRRTS